MPAKSKKKIVAKKTSAVRAKPKSSKNATAKKVSRARTSAKRATTATTSSAKKAAPAAAATSAASAQPFAVQPEAMLKMGADAVRNMMAGMPEAASMFAGGADQAQASNQSVNDIMSVGKDNIDTAVTCGSIAVNASKNLGAEMFNYANKSFSQNVEMSKEMFGCRTLNDMFDLQSKLLKTNMEHFINESVKMSEMMFKVANQVSEPLNERISDTTKQLSKSVSGAA